MYRIMYVIHVLYNTILVCNFFHLRPTYTRKVLVYHPISTCKWLLSMQQYCTNLLLNNLPPMHHKYYLLLPYASICQPLLDRGHQSFLSACYKDLLPSNRNGQLDWQPLHRKAPNASSTLSLLLCYSSFWITIFGAHMFLSVHFRIFA